MSKTDAPNVTPSADRLDSWKAIASHLGRGVTTVQRWEQDEGLPVHRLPHAKKGSVFAYGSELDAWVAGRSRLARSETPRSEVEPAAAAVATAAEPVQPRRLTTPLAIAAALVVTVAGFAAFVASQRPAAGAVSTPTSASGPLASAFTPSASITAAASTAAAERGPSLSPDGRRLAFSMHTDTEGGVYVKDLPSGTPRLVWPFHPVQQRVYITKWSPRGDRIAFNSLEGPDTYGLYVATLDGRSTTRLTAMAGIGICWNGDGTAVTFADRTSATEPFSLYAIDIGSGTRRRLTTPPAGSFGDTACAWSADGTRLALARFVTRYEADVYLVTAGAAPRRLVRGSGGISDLVWTPDDREVVFTNEPGLRRVAADGAQPAVEIPGIAGDILRLAFSRPANPGEATLAYETRSRGAETWTHAIATATSARWAPALEVDSEFPAVSPDGRMVAFMTRGQVWVGDIGGVSPRQVTFFDGDEEPRIVTAPRWSPDGTRLTFSVPVGGQRDIYLVDRDGSHSFRLTSEPSLEDNPSWSCDGDWVYFRSDRGGRNHIWKAPASGGAAVQVTQGEGWQAAESHDGATLYFTRAANAAGLWAQPIDGGTERLVLPDVLESRWAVTDRGVLYTTSRAELRHWTFGAEHSEAVGTLPAAAGLGFSATSDGRFVLWTREVRQRPDILMVAPWSRVGPR